jgi:hypothetical protein
MMVSGHGLAAGRQPVGMRFADGVSRRHQRDATKLRVTALAKVLGSPITFPASRPGNPLGSSRGGTLRLATPPFSRRKAAMDIHCERHQLYPSESAQMV